MYYLEKIVPFSLACLPHLIGVWWRNRGEGFTKYAMSNLGMIGIEVEPVKNTGIWAESGKSYDELTVEDMKAAFSNTIQVLVMLLLMVESLRIQVLKMVRGM